jgi:hypothetical protein
LLLIDIDNNTLRRLSIPGLPSLSDVWAFSFDDANTRLIITVRRPSDVTTTKIPIPTDPTNVAGYTATTSTLALDSGVSLDSDATSGSTASAASSFQGSA